MASTPHAPEGAAMSLVGTTYLERGESVLVLYRWSGKGPRNVLIRRSDGARVVRPFRGLRRLPEPAPVQATLKEEGARSEP
jgi:hypothetical protein